MYPTEDDGNPKRIISDANQKGKEKAGSLKVLEDVDFRLESNF